MGLENAPSLLIVGVYFQRNFNLVHGIVMIGSMTGQLIFVTSFAYLRDAYGWRGIFLIFASVTANVMVCGAIFRPLKDPLQRHSEIENGSRKSNVPVDEALKEPLENYDDPAICGSRQLYLCFVKLKCYSEASFINTCITNHIFILYQIVIFCLGAGIFPLTHLVNKAVVGGNSKENATMLITIIINSFKIQFWGKNT